MPPDRDELEGGFLQTDRSKVYKGTVRERESKKVHWVCDHVHSRPEYNARWQEDEDAVWEYSALNCGRVAHGQWPKPKGAIGLVGRTDVPNSMRDDVREASVDGDRYIGRVTLRENGERQLRVSAKDHPWAGTIILDQTGHKGVRPPGISGHELEKWATAAWLLRGVVWGVVFQDPGVSMSEKGPLDIALKETLGPDYLENRDRRLVNVLDTEEPAKKAKQKKTEPHIRVARDSGRRLFEVVGWDGEVIETFVHRGLAVQALKEVKT